MNAALSMDSYAARYVPQRTPLLSHGRTKFLVVEDDISLQSIWERIIESVDPTAMIRWARTEEGAEKLIQDRQRVGDEFDCIIVDIMLAGEKTGIDLWNRYGDTNTQFLFTSSLPFKKFSKMIGHDHGAYQFFLEKPLNPKRCASYLKMMLGVYSRL